MFKRSSVWVAFFQAVSCLTQLRVWIPLLVYFGIKIIVMGFYLTSVHSALAGFWGLFLESGMRESVSHYPWHLIMMPAVLGKLDIGLDVLVHVVFQGATLVLFTGLILKRETSLGSAFRETTARYVSVIGVTVLATVALYLVIEGVGRLVQLSPVGLSTFTEALIIGFVALIIQALFIFTLPLVILSKRTILSATKESFRMAGKAFGQTYVLVAIPFILTMPTIFVETKAVGLVNRLSPEILIHMEIAKELLQWLSSLLLIGTLAIVFNRRVRGSEKSE